MIPHVSARTRSTVRFGLRRLSGTVALALGLLLAGSLVPAAAAVPDAWSANDADGGNSANNPGESVITAANAGRLTKAWESTVRIDTPYAPVVAGGVVYRVVTSNAGPRISSLTAVSPRTGATLWQVALPDEWYAAGLAVTGHYAVVPYYSWDSSPGGVLAVDLSTRRVLWRTSLPPTASHYSWMGNQQTGLPYTDGTRVYVRGSSNDVNTYRLTDGALLWTLPITDSSQGTPNRVDGIAVGSGAVVTSGDQGVIAYDGATGRKLWRGAASGRPVVAGGRVFVSSGGGVTAFSATGCGKATCPPLWSKVLSVYAQWPEVGGADASTLFVTYQKDLPAPAGSSRGSTVGVVARLSAATGALQWTASIGTSTTGLVRGGNTIWFYDEYVASDGTVADRILGYSATATGTAPSRIMPLPSDYEWFPQNLAIASGTLLEQDNSSHLVGYRVPGT